MNFIIIYKYYKLVRKFTVVNQINRKYVYFIFYSRYNKILRIVIESHFKKLHSTYIYLPTKPTDKNGNLENCNVQLYSFFSMLLYFWIKSNERPAALFTLSSLRTPNEWYGYPPVYPFIVRNSLRRIHNHRVGCVV